MSPGILWRSAVLGAFGHNTKAMAVGLPGNPVSSMVCFENSSVLALRRIMGMRGLIAAP